MICHLRIERREAAGIMGGQGDSDPVVDVRPFGVVVQPLRGERQLRHEAESLAEVGEDELTRDQPSARSIESPLRSRSQKAGELLVVEPRHQNRAALSASRSDATRQR